MDTQSEHAKKAAEQPGQISDPKNVIGSKETESPVASPNISIPGNAESSTPFPQKPATSSTVPCDGPGGGHANLRIFVQVMASCCASCLYLKRLSGHANLRIFVQVVASCCASCLYLKRVAPSGNVQLPWAFNPAMVGMPWNGGHLDEGGFVPPMIPIFLPYCPVPTNEQNGGIFIVPTFPAMAPFPSGGAGLVPFTYNIPTNASTNAATQGPAGTSGTRSFEGEPPLQADAPEAAMADGMLRRRAPHAERVPQAQRGGGEGQGPRMEGQRHIVRRFHIGFQVDLLLILKLAVVVFVFNQDGSKDRLLLLLFLASLIYLYQTGALTPLLQWISQTAQRAMMPPQPGNPQPVPAEGQREGQEAAGNAANNRGPEGAQGAEGAPAGVQGEGQGAQAHNWWGIFKELQMLVVGFVTSLLPGFQHIE